MIPRNSEYEDVIQRRPLRGYEFGVDGERYLCFVPTDSEPTGDDFCLYRVATAETHEQARRGIVTGEGTVPLIWLDNGEEYYTVATLMNDYSEGRVTIIYEPDVVVAQTEKIEDG